MQHQPQHGPAAPAPLQTRQRQAALLRFKRIQAADTQILPAGWRKSGSPRRARKGFYRPQRRQFLIAIALLPVKLRPLRLLAAP
jgi:hypothetical protein